jgi:hypothetical protein
MTGHITVGPHTDTSERGREALLFRHKGETDYRGPIHWERGKLAYKPEVINMPELEFIKLNPITVLLDLRN